MSDKGRLLTNSGLVPWPTENFEKTHGVDADGVDIDTAPTHLRSDFLDAAFSDSEGAYKFMIVDAQSVGKDGWSVHQVSASSKFGWSSGIRHVATGSRLVTPASGGGVAPMMATAEPTVLCSNECSYIDKSVVRVACHAFAHAFLSQLYK